MKYKVYQYEYYLAFPPCKEGSWNTKVEAAVAKFKGESQLSWASEEEWMGKLTKNWNGHPKGSYILGGLTVMGHPFWIIENETK